VAGAQPPFCKRIKTYQPGARAGLHASEKPTGLETNEPIVTKTAALEGQLTRMHACLHEVKAQVKTDATGSNQLESSVGWGMSSQAFDRSNVGCETAKCALVQQEDKKRRSKCWDDSTKRQ